MLMKMVEVHDDGITIMVLAIKLVPSSDHEKAALVGRGGFNADGSDVLVIEMDSEHATTDPYRWPSLGVHRNTLPVAHQYIKRNWERLPDGQVQVINVAKILDAELYPMANQDVSDPSRLDEDDT